MINLIAAIDLNSALGHENELLVKLPKDLKRFKELTTNQICVFGRKTYQSIGFPLPDRKTIVITRDSEFKAPEGVEVYDSLEYVLYKYGRNELFICGGSEIYNQSLQYADRIYLTVIDHTFPKADAHFPKFDISNWEVVEHEKYEADEKHPYGYSFVTYERKKNNK